MPDLKILHRLIRYMSSLAVASFFTEVSDLSASRMDEGALLFVILCYFCSRLYSFEETLCFFLHETLHQRRKKLTPILQVRVIGGENVPKEGPIIVWVATPCASSYSFSFSCFLSSTSYSSRSLFRSLLSSLLLLPCSCLTPLLCASLPSLSRFPFTRFRSRFLVSLVLLHLLLVSLFARFLAPCFARRSAPCFAHS